MENNCFPSPKFLECKSGVIYSYLVILSIVIFYYLYNFSIKLHKISENPSISLIKASLFWIAGIISTSLILFNFLFSKYYILSAFSNFVYLLINAIDSWPFIFIIIYLTKIFSNFGVFIRYEEKIIEFSPIFLFFLNLSIPLLFYFQMGDFLVEHNQFFMLSNLILLGINGFLFLYLIIRLFIVENELCIKILGKDNANRYFIGFFIIFFIVLIRIISVCLWSVLPAPLIHIWFSKNYEDNIHLYIFVYYLSDILIHIAPYLLLGIGINSSEIEKESSTENHSVVISTPILLSNEI